MELDNERKRSIQQETSIEETSNELTTVPEEPSNNNTVETSNNDTTELSNNDTTETTNNGTAKEDNDEPTPAVESIAAVMTPSDTGSRFYIKRRILIGNVSKYIPPGEPSPLL